jgi:hypothetical protein
MIVARFSPDGNSLIFSTYLGGNGNDFTETHGLAVDQNGNAYVAITTTSTDLPTSAGAFQRSYAGSGKGGRGNGTNYSGDVFVAKISPDGKALLAGTYAGGKQGEGAEGIAVDSLGNVVFSGATYSDDFPITANGYQTVRSGDADLFVAKLSADLHEIIYGSYLGAGQVDYGRTAAIDAVGNIYVGGMSKSPGWPVRGPSQSSYGGGWDAVLASISVAPAPAPVAPVITAASVSGKRLFVTGEKFAIGAELMLNEERQRKTSNDPDSPTTLLVARKSGKKIAAGDTVRLQVRNPDGGLSDVLNFTRPPKEN